MRRAAYRVFNGRIVFGTIVTNPVYTGAQHNLRMGAHDAFSMQVVMDTFSAPSSPRTLTITIDQSLDGVNWKTGGDTMNVAIPANQTAPLTQMYSNAFLGLADSGPLFSIVRFSLYFSNTDIAANTQVFVAVRE